MGLPTSIGGTSAPFRRFQLGRAPPWFSRPSMAADATVRAPLRREKSFYARSFDADDLPVHTLNTDESLS
eukprot:2424407-Prymnesium_polylepis.2